VQQIRLERIWTAAGWPRSAQCGGVRLRMSRTIPPSMCPRLLLEWFRAASSEDHFVVYGRLMVRKSGPLNRGKE